MGSLPNWCIFSVYDTKSYVARIIDALQSRLAIDSTRRELGEKLSAETHNSRPSRAAGLQTIDEFASHFPEKQDKFLSRCRRR
jgi:hypothetical protein